MATLESLSALLASLPPSANPYSALSDALHDTITAPVPRGFRIVLIFNFAFFSLSWCLTLATVVAKIVDGQTWLVRSRNTPRGTLYLPNTSLLYSSFAWLYLTLGLVYIGLIYATYIGEYTQLPLQAIEAPVWTCLAIAMFSEAFGVASSYFLSRASTPTKSWVFKAATFNIACVGIFSGLIVAVLRAFVLLRMI